MTPAAVRVPDSLLLNRELSGSAKLLWMICKLSAPARHTVLRALAQLGAGGWLTARRDPTASYRASVPGDLLLDHRIGTPAKLRRGTAV
jgi:hypothetical protein